MQDETNAEQFSEGFRYRLTKIIHPDGTVEASNDSRFDNLVLTTPRITTYTYDPDRVQNQAGGEALVQPNIPDGIGGTLTYVYERVDE